MKSKKTLFVLSAAMIVSLFACSPKKTTSSANKDSTSINSTDSNNKDSSDTTSQSTDSNSSVVEEVTKGYQITFKDTQQEKTDVDLTSSINDYVESTGVFTTFTGEKIFSTSGKFIRIGSSSNPGSFILNSIEKVKIVKVIVTASLYGSDTKVNVKTTLSTGKTSTRSLTSDASTDLTFEFNDEGDSNQVKIETLKDSTNSKKPRMYIEKVSVFAKGGSNPSVDIEDGGNTNTPEENKKSIKCTSSFTVGNGNASSTKVNYDGYYKAALSDFNLDTLLNDYQDDPKLPSTGKSKLLVVPVDFTDYKASSKLTSEDKAQQDIYDLFFGKTEDTGWESVKTYYEKASYGALSLEGEVTPWFHSEYSTTDFLALTNSTEGYDPTWTMLEDVTNWCKNTLKIDLSEYDTNNDGLIDGVWMVYACPYDYNDNSDIYWAYTYSDYSISKPSVTDPKAYAYCWASYSFMQEGGYDKPDAHTYIHETGHLLGLDDYYNYDNGSTATDEGACGGVDMMDFNIGDHNAYSKYLLNWTTPYVVDDTKNEVNITLKPFENSGDCILLRDQKTDKWNGSVFDEYILIEYYTPTGLNEKDTTPYTYNLGTYTEPGVKIWHIDSRLYKDVYDESDNWVSGEYVDSFSAYDYSEWYSILASNTPSSSYDPDTGDENSPFRTIQLIQSSGTNTFVGKEYDKDYGENSNLFHTGDVFNMSNFKDFFSKETTMNDGSSFPYTVTIGEMNTTGVSIKITK